MQARTLTVISSLPDRSAACASLPPRVLTEELLGKLRALNRAVRWLRQNGHPPLTTDSLGTRPLILVDPQAGDFLCRAGRGMTTRRPPGGECFQSVVIDDCEIRWYTPEQQ